MRFRTKFGIQGWCLVSLAILYACSAFFGPHDLQHSVWDFGAAVWICCALLRVLSQFFYYWELDVPAIANQDIDSTLRENRVFPPPPEFSAKAHIKSLEEYEALYKQSIDDPEAFWAGRRRTCTGSSPGTRCWSGICPGPSGLWAAS
jgi:hypothetical protein